jgi:hypothetical protein
MSPVSPKWSRSAETDALGAAASLVASLHVADGM